MVCGASRYHGLCCANIVGWTHLCLVLIAAQLKAYKLHFGQGYFCAFVYILKLMYDQWMLGNVGCSWRSACF